MSQVQDQPIPVTTVATAAPDWPLIAETIHCPLCAYDLRGLVEPLCPECGYRFAWNELLDAQIRAHPYLFEHARRRFRRSFLKTNLAGWWPWMFWRSIRPQQRINLPRLKLYWFLSAAGFFIALAMLILIEPLPATLAGSANFDQGLNNYVQFLVHAEWHIESALLLAGMLYALWPVMTYLTLRIFAQSMHRAMVRPEHVVRCTLYACDAGFAMLWLLVGLTIALMWMNVVPYWWNYTFGMTTLLLLMASLLYATVTATRLAVSYRLYLRFPHPRSTAIASQVIVFLFAAAVVMTLWSVT